MFVDKNRGMAVLMGEKDNKKAIDKRRKNLIKEKQKYGKSAGDLEDEVDLNWDHYYTKVKFHNDKFEKVIFSPRPTITRISGITRPG